jgi:hypothetical protein
LVTVFPDSVVALGVGLGAGADVAEALGVGAGAAAVAADVAEALGAPADGGPDPDGDDAGEAGSLLDGDAALLWVGAGLGE